MTSSKEAFSIRPDKARLIVEDSLEILGQIMYERTALVALMCPPTAWGQLGSPAAAGTQQFMQQLNQALLTLIQFHEQLHKQIKRSADRYQNQDLDTESQYLALRKGLPC